jgi:hypothetical protein
VKATRKGKSLREIETGFRDQNRAKRAAKLDRKHENNPTDDEDEIRKRKADKIVSPHDRKKAIKASRHKEWTFSDEPSTYDKKREKRKKTVKKMLKFKNKLSRNKGYTSSKRGVSKVGLGWGGAMGKRKF